MILRSSNEDIARQIEYIEMESEKLDRQRRDMDKFQRGLRNKNSILMAKERELVNREIDVQRRDREREEAYQ